MELGKKPDIGSRVEIPAYTDHWMMGNRFGEIIRIKFRNETNKHGTVIRRKLAHVRLDVKGRIARVWLDDCKAV